MTVKPVILTLLLFIGIGLPVRGQSLPFACTGSLQAYGVQGMPNSVYFWEIDGGELLDTIFGVNNDTIAIKWNYDRRNHSITVTEQTEFGCFGIPVGGQLEIDAPVADIGDEEEVCRDDVFTFDGTTTYTSNLTYLWPDGSTQTTYATGTEGYVWVRVTGADQCSDYDSVYLTVNALPDVNIGNDTSLCGTDLILLDAGDYDSYLWSTGDIINPISVDGERTVPEVFWVEVTDENGCRGSDTIIFEVCDAALLFANMPNTITPGDDTHNNEWVIPYIELFPDAVLEIFDRWGRLVYRTDDVAGQPWKGETMSGKELPMDAYFFVLDIKVAHVKPVTGYVNIIR